MKLFSRTRTECTHLAEQIAEPRTQHCEECGSTFNLRLCTECGHVGCCDNSPGRHATGHFHESAHALIQSFEPGEEWIWCYVDEVAVEIEGAAPSPAHS